ncbi:MAG: cache domain-containing protein, partial [Microvirgula sp.]
GQSTVIQNWFGEKKQQLSALTGVAAGPNALANLKQGALAGNFFINYVGFPDGRSIFSDDWVATPDYIVTEKPWYVQAKTTGKPTITEPYVDQVSKRLVLTVAVPMLEGGQFHGVVAGDVFVDELVKSVLSLKPRGDGYTFIVNKQGTVIAHPDNGLTLKSISTIAPSLVPERLAAIAESHALNEVDINGKTMLVAIEQIPGTDWYMGITADKDLIFAPLNAELFKTVGMSLLLFILVGVVSSVVIGRMLSGLTRLRDAMAGIASGEGEGDL